MGLQNVKWAFGLFISLANLSHASAQTLSAPAKQAIPALDTKNPAAKPVTPAKELERQNRKYQSLESFARVLNLLEGMYVDEKAADPDALVDKAIKGMVSGLDPHTTYLTASQLKEIATDTSGKFGGIGVVISQANNRLEIIEVMDKSPAFRAGLHSGDVIYAIDGVVVTPKNTEEILSKMRGLPGSSVKLEVYSSVNNLEAKKQNKKSVHRTVVLKREVIHSSSVTHAKLSKGYSYIRVAVFQEDSGEEIDKLLREHEAQNGGKLSGLILDLRNNPGGLLDQAVKITDLFIDSGIIVSTIGRNRTQQDVEYASKRTTHPNMPMVVLVNEGSASASEIVAGALQDHDRALVVGVQTFGKGSVQSIIPLPNEGGLKMTIARYYTPKGRSIQAKGITPDIILAVDKKAEEKRSNEKRTKEADLAGHIESTDLPEARSSSFAADVEKWPENLRKDSQLLSAYTYLKSWSRFMKSSPGNISKAQVPETKN